MVSLNECLIYYHTLLQLLAEDYDMAQQCFQGEFLGIYHAILESEKSIITDAYNTIIYNK